MRCGRLVLGIAVAVLSGAFARAEGLFPKPDRELIFAGIDLWSGGGFAHAGMVWSSNGLDREGFALKSLMGAGAYRYRRNGIPSVGLQSVAAIMPGWRLLRPSFDLGIYAGIDFQEHRFWPADPDNRLRGRHVGLRISADLWWEPAPSFMINAGLSASHINSNYWMRGAAGWRLIDAIWLGPEFIAQGDTSYRQLRFGAHATGLQIGPWELSAGAGWATDSDGRSGIYGRIGTVRRR